MSTIHELGFTESQLFYLENIQAGASYAYILACIGMIFFMQSGFIVVECGSIKKCHYSDVVVKNILDSITGVLGFWLAGFGIAFGTSNTYGLFGIDGRYYASKEFGTMQEENLWIKWLFQLAFCNTSSTIVSGLMTEKCRIEVYAVVSFFMSFFIYPVVAHWAWNENGWLAVRGYQDFAGSGVIHMLGGLVGLIGNIFSGSRIRKNPGKLQFPFLKGQLRLKKLQQFEENERKNVENIQEVEEIQEIAEKNILNEDDIRNMQRSVLEDYDYPSFCPESYGSVFIAIGVYILFTGWMFFNAGSAYTVFPSKGDASVAKIITNTIIAAGAASLVSCIFKVPIMNFKPGKRISQCFKRSHMYDLSGQANGLLAGLVAITASCNVVEPYSSLVIGLIGGFVYCFFIKLLNSWNIDDHIEASAVHFANGIWGLLACFIFDNKRGLFTSHEGKGSYVAVQCYAILSIFAWGTICSLVFFGVFYCIGWYKYHPVVEQMGVGNFKMGEMGKRFKVKIFPNQTGNKVMKTQLVLNQSGMQQQSLRDIFEIGNPIDEQISSISSKQECDNNEVQVESQREGLERNQQVNNQANPDESSFRSVNLALLNNLEQSYQQNEQHEEEVLKSEEVISPTAQQKLGKQMKKISQTQVMQDPWNIKKVYIDYSVVDFYQCQNENQEQSEEIKEENIHEIDYQPDLEFGLDKSGEEESISDISIDDDLS